MLLSHPQRVEALTCGVGDIAARLGEPTRPARWQARLIAMLIADQDFPQPLPLMIGRRLITDAHPRSKWSRVAVDQWFDDRIAPDTAARIDRAAQAAAAGDMDARADALGLRLVAGGRR